VNAPAATRPAKADRDMQEPLGTHLAGELAAILRRMDVLDGIGEKAASKAMAALPDAKALGDRLACLDFAFGEGVDHAFASWQLRSEPDEEFPRGEVETDAALAIMLLNEAVYTNVHRSAREATEGPRDASVLYVTCSDVFAWGSSDLEIMPHDRIAEVFDHWERDPRWGTAVWCMIQRRELPQRPVLERIRKDGIWDMAALTAEHGLKPNHYDGVSMAMAVRKRDAYVAWCAERGVEPLPFDAKWWEGWREYAAAHPGWYDDAWKAGDAEAREAWRAANGFGDAA
jgi:hypothetical protein